MRSGMLQGSLAAGGALLPMGLPARWLAGAGLAKTLVTQAGAGAAINTAFGAAGRVADSAILRDAGYDTMADQAEPWDAKNILADAISGAFFGAHTGWHGLKAGVVDPSTRDAALVVKDRQAVNDLAPGVPVDMKSAAIHRQALEESLDALVSRDEAPKLHADDVDGASFAQRPGDDEAQARQIMRDEFVKSGVLDDAAQFDKWLENGFSEEIPKVETKPIETTEMMPAGDEENQPSPQAIGALADRPDLQIASDDGEPISAASAHETAMNAEAQAEKEAEPMFQTAAACGARFA